MDKVYMNKKKGSMNYKSNTGVIYATERVMF